MTYRNKFKKANPEFERINRGLPMDIHHDKQQCDGGSDDLSNLKPMLKGRHEKHKHHGKGKTVNKNSEDYLFDI